MSKEENNITEIIFGILIGATAIMAIRAVFSNDASRIISTKGRKILTDKEKMLEFEEKLEKNKQNKFEDIYL